MDVLGYHIIWGLCPRQVRHSAGAHDGAFYFWGFAAASTSCRALARARAAFAKARAFRTTAAVARQLADDAAAKKQQAKELNKKLDDMMETARVENEERQTRAQAKRRATLAGIAAVSQKHTKEFRDMQEMRRNTETVDAFIPLDNLVCDSGDRSLYGWSIQDQTAPHSFVVYRHPPTLPNLSGFT